MADVFMAFRLAIIKLTQKCEKCLVILLKTFIVACKVTISELRSCLLFSFPGM